MACLYCIEIWGEYVPEYGRYMWVASCSTCDYASGYCDTEEEARAWAGDHKCSCSL